MKNAIESINFYVVASSSAMEKIQEEEYETLRLLI